MHRTLLREAVSRMKRDRGIHVQSPRIDWLERGSRRRIRVMNERRESYEADCQRDGFKFVLTVDRDVGVFELLLVSRCSARQSWFGAEAVAATRAHFNFTWCWVFQRARKRIV